MALVVTTGFEHGSNAGLLVGNTNNRFATGASGTVVSTSPHGGTYCWERNAAGQLIYWDTNIIGTSMKVVVLNFWVYFPSSLPSAEVAFAEVRCPTAQNIYLTYNNTTGKFKVHDANGVINTDLSVGPTANTWHHIEFKVDVSANPHRVDTWIDGAPQTQMTRGVAADTIGTWVGFPGDTAEIGNNAGTFRIDDVAIYTDAAAITTPIGAHSVKLLSVDPADTVTLSGTAANFNTFTSNGTLAAWNATTARNNIDEIPPTIGASADGFVQVTLATSDYVQIPMTTYTLGGGETIAGARMEAVGWATSATAATLGFRSYNGTTETILQAGTVNPLFDASTTAPGWVCKMLTLADIDTQAELNALVFRVGFSNDATPDEGIHAIYAEVAILVPWPAGVWCRTPRTIRQAVNRAATF